MTKIEMARFYGNKNNRLNAVIEEVERHCNDIVVMITKQEESISSLQSDLKKLTNRHETVSDAVSAQSNRLDHNLTDVISLKQTIAGLMERVSKLEIKTANLYEPGKGGLVQSTAFNLDLSNLDTKKEHALRLQLRDTKEQFKQLEEAHRKLVKAHKTLQKSYTEKEIQYKILVMHLREKKQ